MNRTKKILWESKKNNFSLTEVILLALITFTIVLLLRSSFNRVIDNTLIADAEFVTDTKKDVDRKGAE